MTPDPDLCRHANTVLIERGEMRLGVTPEKRRCFDCDAVFIVQVQEKPSCQ